MSRMDIDGEAPKSFYDEYEQVTIDEMKLDKLLEENEKLKSEKAELERHNKMLLEDFCDKNERISDLNAKYSDSKDNLKKINTEFEKLQREKEDNRKYTEELERMLTERNDEIQRLKTALERQMKEVQQS